jgi:tetratricopeptide (TPR) repeat protein
MSQATVQMKEFHMPCHFVSSCDTILSQDVGKLRDILSGFAVGRLPGVLLLALIATPLMFAAEVPVKVWEEQVTIPTYLVGPPDPNPHFYLGSSTVSQGAQQRIYPYPSYDNLTAEKKAKSYTMVYLENEYVKIGILPEIGGKVFEAVDKTNGYEFVYHQHVIKPALISVLGAWTSGGIEWDIPHHHRGTSFLPTQYKVDESADGSKTVWVGELELRDRMRWVVGVTLHPGKSYVETLFRIANRTPLPASMLCWSNVAVSVNDSYQVIFPPRTQYVVYHRKIAFTTWPVATTQYAGLDYTTGVDVSWYKNHVNGTSMFAWNYQDDFVAGYDHGKKAGTMSVADHNIVPGKKFFTWGTGQVGQSEDWLLTDSDGPYMELMSGAYSDNQPDYSWLAPYETRSWSQHWYPFRDIGGVKNANIDAAVNLEVKDGRIHLGFYSTSDHPAAEVTLRLKDRILDNEQIAINPAKPWVREIKLPAGADEHDLRASLAADGRELIAYSPVRLGNEAMPSPIEPPAPYSLPAQIATNEELYLTGLRAEQFHNATANPQTYWEEALRRDPGDVRVNTAMGIDCQRAGRFADAEEYLRKALERATNNYTSPKDGEPFYYLGLALKAQGKDDDAISQFSKSTWSAAWRSPGYFEMAEIATLRGDNDAALAYTSSSLEANAKNVRALALRAALLRHTGHNDQARVTVAALQAIDSLDVHAMAERWLDGRSADDARNLASTLNSFLATGLEAAADYMNAGLWDDGNAVLTLMTDTASGKSTVSPLAYYYLGYFAQKLNQQDKATEYFRLAAQGPVDYAFPFQMEMIAVLEHAMQANPSDSRAPYYLGNLLYDWQPDRAVALWQKSASLGADFPVVYHNLALVYRRQGNQRDKELAVLETAVKFGGSAMVFNELDKLYEENGVAPEKRLALMEAHQSVINRDDVISREINLDIAVGKADAAIQLLRSRFFRAWEGGGRFSLGDSWINANLLKGRQQFARRQYQEALASYKAAFELPDNLQDAATDTSTRRAEISYWIGTAYEALGDKSKAQQVFREASEATASRTAAEGERGYSAPGQFGGHTGLLGGLASGTFVARASTYYQALALEKLSQADRAKPMFKQLIDAGTQALDAARSAEAQTKSGNPSGDRARVADAYYLVGLGQLGLNNQDKAKQEFSRALEVSPDHFAARMALQKMSR